MAHLSALSEAFFAFVKREIAKDSNVEFDTTQIPQDDEYDLNEWLGRWVKSEDCLETCGEDFAVYAQAIIGILLRIFHDVPWATVQGRKFAPVLGQYIDEDHPNALDRDEWNASVFTYKYGRSQTPVSPTDAVAKDLS